MLRSKIKGFLFFVLALVAIIMTSFSAFAAKYSFDGRWEKASTDWYHYDTTNVMEKDTWVVWQGKLYRMGSDGKLIRGNYSDVETKNAYYFDNQEDTGHYIYDTGSHSSSDILRLIGVPENVVTVLVTQNPDMAVVKTSADVPLPTGEVKAPTASGVSASGSGGGGGGGGSTTTKYTVKFDMQGHGTQVASQTVEKNKYATKPTNPTATGYKFVHWYTTDEDVEFNFSATKITSNITLYAKWESSVTKYTVTFDMQGHGTQVPKQTVEKNKYATKPANPTADGYKFVRWYTTNQEVEFNFATTKITANITIKALWKEVKNYQLPSLIDEGLSSPTEGPKRLNAGASFTLSTAGTKVQTAIGAVTEIGIKFLVDKDMDDYTTGYEDLGADDNGVNCKVGMDGTTLTFVTDGTGFVYPDAKHNDLMDCDIVPFYFAIIYDDYFGLMGKTINSIDITNTIVGNGKKMDMLFAYYNGTDLDLSTMNVGTGPESAVNMFAYCSNLVNIDLGDVFSSGSCESFHYLFDNCTSLTTIDVSDINTSNATDLCGMFHECSGLTSITGLGNFDTSKVETMWGMFQNCENLTGITGLTNFNTPNLTNMGYMFYGCTNITSLDLSSFNCSGIDSVNFMFGNPNIDSCRCTALNEIKMIDNLFTYIWNHQSSGNNSCLKIIWDHYTRTGDSDPYTFTKGGTLGAVPVNLNPLGLAPEELLDLEDIATDSEAEFVEVTEAENLELSEESLEVGENETTQESNENLELSEENLEEEETAESLEFSDENLEEEETTENLELSEETLEDEEKENLVEGEEGSIDDEIEPTEEEREVDPSNDVEELVEEQEEEEGEAEDDDDEEEMVPTNVEEEEDDEIEPSVEDEETIESLELRDENLDKEEQEEKQGEAKDDEDEDEFNLANVKKGNEEDEIESSEEINETEPSKVAEEIEEEQNKNESSDEELFEGATETEAETEKE